MNGEKPRSEDEQPKIEQNVFTPTEYDLKQLELKRIRLKEMADAIHAKPESQVTDKELDAYTELVEEIEKKERLFSENELIDNRDQKAA
jgi:hypothetical protein